LDGLEGDEDRKMKREEVSEKIKAEGEILKNKEVMEKVINLMSIGCLERLKKTGKSLREIFNMFSKNESFGYMSEEQFLELMDFVLRDRERFSEDTFRTLFRWFASDISRRLSFKVFNNMIMLGRKINPIYLKFKAVFKESKQSIRKYWQELQFCSLTTKRWTLSRRD
jgi:hypothetical protein